MDNDYRKLWDSTIVSHEQLQVDKNTGLEIGRTVKKFTFLKAREYILAWRLWEGSDGSFYCFTKVICIFLSFAHGLICTFILSSQILDS